MAAATSTLIPLQITVTSDTICPFCFLGLRKLEKALSLSPLTSPTSTTPKFTPSIRFLPFQLDPTLPTAHSVSKRERYAAKFGASRITAMETQMKANGKPYGIEFNYDGPIRNTTLSHRLMEVAYEKGGWEKQLKLLNLLFPHYFEHAGDPGDIEQLVRIAVDSGVFERDDEAKEFLEGNQFAEEVQRAFREAHAKSITGVPHFELLAGDLGGDVKVIKAEIPGAQEPETFVAVFKQIAEAYARANGSGGGGPASVAGAATSGQTC